MTLTSKLLNNIHELIPNKSYIKLLLISIYYKKYKPFNPPIRCNLLFFISNLFKYTFADKSIIYWIRLLPPNKISNEPPFNSMLYIRLYSILSTFKYFNYLILLILFILLWLKSSWITLEQFYIQLKFPITLNCNEIFSTLINRSIPSKLPIFSKVNLISLISSTFSTFKQSAIDFD